MEYKKLSEIADIVSGYAIPSDCMADVGTPILKITNIREDNTIDLENTAKYTLPIEPKLNKFLLRDKDILVCMTGATIGKVARKVKVEGQYIVNQRVAIIRPKNPKDSDFVYYILKEPTFRRYVELVGYGAAQPNISASAIGKFCFACDDKLSRISIGSILSAYDNLIEANSRRIKILEQMAENLYKEWFVRFRFPNYQNIPIENGIPKGWKVEKLKKITKRLPFNRLYKASDLEPEGDVIVIDQSTSAYLGFHNNEPSHYANIDDPIIIFGDHSCKFQLMIQNFSLGENVIPFISNDFNTIDNYFFYYATHKLIETEEYKRHWGRLMAMKILIPSINIQRAFSQIVKPIHSEIATLQTQSANLTRQRDLLLLRLMSGQLPTQ